MLPYTIKYSAVCGACCVEMDGTNDRIQRPTGADASQTGYAFAEGSRYAYQTKYDCPPEEQLARYLDGTIVTHIYRMDRVTGEEKELFTQSRPFPMVQCNGMQIFDGSYLCQTDVPGNLHRTVWSADEDGLHWKAITPPDEAFVYGLCLNPARDVLACHVTSTQNEVYDYMPTEYSINTIDLSTGKRILVDSREDTCLFGPTFSPNGEWLLYIAGCYDRFSPRSSMYDRHMFDLVLARPDGSEVIDLTQGLVHYNRTSFGPPEQRRRGSNPPIWLDDQTVLYSKRSPGAHPDCNFDPSLGNHREDPYDPSMARGGCQLMALNIFTREETPITPLEEGRWDFRALLSPDKEWLVYTSARSGGKPSSIRLCRVDGSEDRHLTYGVDGLGVDFPTFSEK